MAELTPTATILARAPRRTDPRRALLNGFSYVWLPIGLVALWWFASAGSNSIYIPSLERIIEVLVRDLSNGTLVVNTGWSLLNLSLGLFFAIVIGISGGIALGEWNAARETVEPIVNFARSVPQVALVPLIIGALGIGIWPKVVIITVACLWPILLNTIDGVRAVDPVARSMARIYRIPRSLYFRRVVLPSAAPQILSGVRVSLGIGVTVMVVAEIFASDRGLGFYIVNAAQTFRFPESWAGALLVGIIGYLLTLVFLIVERTSVRWYFASGAR